MKKIYLILLCFLLFAININVKAQNKRVIDSLTFIYKHSIEDTLKIKALISIAYEYRYLRPDTSILLLDKARKSAQTKGLIKQEIECIAELGYVFWVQTKYDTAIVCAENALLRTKNKNLLKIEARSFQLLGMCKRDLGKYPLAIDFFFKSLKLNETLQLKREIANCNNNIGEVYKIIENDTLALEYYSKALKIRQEIKDNHGLSRIYLNYAELYIERKEYKKAVQYSMLSLQISEQISNKLQIANNLTVLANCFYFDANYAKSINYVTRALDYYNQLKSKKEIAKTLGILAHNYLKLGKTSLAEQAGKESFALAHSQHLLPIIHSSSLILYEIYKQRNENESSLKYLEFATSAKDSMFSMDKNKKIGQLKFGYELEKKQKELELAELNTAVQHKITCWLAVGLVLLCFMSVLIYLSRKKLQTLYNLVKTQQAEILEKNEDLNLLNEVITVQRDNMEEFAGNLQLKNDEITFQKNTIEIKNKKITQSIEYAKRIQTALLPSHHLFSRAFESFFVIYKPKDIVSGDFYWCGQVGSKFILIAADCTGHGVPGAFMSMLGITLMNEIVRNKDVQEASVVLDHLRIQVKEALRQTGKRGEQRDGMDVALCVLDTNTLILQYAGANNPLLLLKKADLLKLNLIESDSISENSYLINADKMPIGVHPHDSIIFKNHEIQLEYGDQFYIYTDGFHSQFGGPNNEKMKTIQFQKKLLKYALLDFQSQKENLEAEFDQWRGSKEQIDDVLVIGVRV